MMLNRLLQKFALYLQARMARQALAIKCFTVAEDIRGWEPLGRQAMTALLIQTPVGYDRRSLGLPFPCVKRARETSPGVYSIEIVLPGYPKETE